VAEVMDAGPGDGRVGVTGRMAAEDAEIVVFMGGDGADDPGSIARLVEPIRSGRYDFVIGSRARGNREPGSIGWHQLAAGRLAGWGMRLLYGVPYTGMGAARPVRPAAFLQLRMSRPPDCGASRMDGTSKCRCGWRGRDCAFWRSRWIIIGGAAASPRWREASLERCEQGRASWRRLREFRATRAGAGRNHSVSG